MSKVTSLWGLSGHLEAWPGRQHRQPERASDFSDNELALQKSPEMQENANTWLRSGLFMTSLGSSRFSLPPHPIGLSRNAQPCSWDAVWSQISGGTADI